MKMNTLLWITPPSFNIWVSLIHVQGELTQTILVLLVKFGRADLNWGDYQLFLTKALLQFYMKILVCKGKHFCTHANLDINKKLSSVFFFSLPDTQWKCILGMAQHLPSGQLGFPDSGLFNLYLSLGWRNGSGFLVNMKLLTQVNICSFSQRVEKVKAGLSVIS